MDLKLCQERQILTQAIHLQESEHKIIYSNKQRLRLSPTPNMMKSEGARKASTDQITLPPPHGSARELAIGDQLLWGLKP